VASLGSTVKIWRVSDGSLETVLGESQGIFYRSACSFSPNGKLLACGGDDGIVRLWNVKDRDDNCFAVSPHVHRLEEGGDVDDDDPIMASVDSIAFTPNGQNLASGGQDGNIFLWDTREFL
jgi:WD40 repeat protein